MRRMKIDPEKAPKGKTDWARIRATTDEDLEAAARTDPDARPLTEADLARMERIPNVHLIRKRLALSQREFGERFGIPLATIRDWEQGRSRPEKGMRSYLHVIERIPQEVRQALHR